MNTPSAEVVNPVPEEADELAKVLTFIEAHEARDGGVSLVGAHDHDRVELTDQLQEILKRVVHALGSGQSISILTRDKEVSTQQAAEILGLSRPTVVRLIDEGELRAHVPGAVRRKLRLVDVLAYREGLRVRRNHFIAESSSEYGDIGADEFSQLLAEARRKA